MLQEKSGHLLDAENNVLKKESLKMTLTEYFDQRNQRSQFRRTRSQTKLVNSLVFSYKMDISSKQTEPMDETVTYTEFRSTNFCSKNADKMDCDNDSDSKINSDALQHSENTSTPMEDVNDDGFIVGCDNNNVDKADVFERPSLDDEATESNLRHSTADKSKERSTQNSKLYLKFVDLAKKRSDLELLFDANDSLKTAINQVVDVMDLKKEHSHFYNAKGNTKFTLDLTFLKN